MQSEFRSEIDFYSHFVSTLSFNIFSILFTMSSKIKNQITNQYKFIKRNNQSVMSLRIYQFGNCSNFVCNLYITTVLDIIRILRIRCNFGILLPFSISTISYEN